MTAPSPLHVVICGGGKTGHLNAVLFKQLPGVKVSILTGSKPLIDRHRKGDCRITAQLPDGGQITAAPDAVSDDAVEVAADADLVIVTVPAHVREAVLQSLRPALPTDKPVYVGAIPGFCGFDWLAEKVFAGQPNVVIWGMKDVPHTAFELAPGVSIRMGGAKSRLHIAAHARETDENRQNLHTILQRLYDAPVDLLDNYLEITLTPGNPIMHSSAIYGLIGPYAQWHQRPFNWRVCWWTDSTELSAYFLERSDEESRALCRAIEGRLKVDLSSVDPLKKEITDAYGDQIRDPHTMLGVLRTNRAYEAIEAPLVPAASGDGYEIDRESRAFHEDIAFGLALLVEMGRRLSVPMPHIEEIFGWCVAHMGGLRKSALDYFPEHWPAERSIA
ncbi:NAD/NADP octopine/nopaline dehydrogenase family protein [Aestuariispira ectoiniformans]|uniref:NAD/NADP octopine/nopaline dehydrogenase family protein n=1 Tax=Aestuariispira ectoiniformans TaxID=2775080 RepID=UPI00223C0C0D|nr:NAD/NADP octopine/nopaline dehydrogenase family protein [Aestuariispira ectoiniformans]